MRWKLANCHLLTSNSQELNELFKSIDTDGSGTLSLSEVILFLKSMCDDISEENIMRIFESLDDSGDKSVDFDEFKVGPHFPLHQQIGFLSRGVDSDGPPQNVPRSPRASPRLPGGDDRRH